MRRITEDASRMRPAVAVVCTFLNAEDTIEATLRSLQAQTAQASQFILVDDGSIDGSTAIAESFTAKDSRFSLVRNPRPGRIRALNFGVSIAQAELIAILDADDVAHPRWLEAGLKTMGESPEFSVIGFSRIFLQGTAAVPIWRTADFNGHPSVTNVTRALVRNNPISHSGAFIRRAHLAAVGGYDASLRYLEDYDLWVRLGTAGYQIGRSGLVRIAKRYHPGQKFSLMRGHSLNSFKVQYQAVRALDRSYVGLIWLSLRLAAQLLRSLRPLWARSVNSIRNR